MADNQVIEYDSEADVLVVNIKANPKVREDKLLDNDIVLSIDEKGELAQIQVMDALRRGLLKVVVTLSTKDPKIRAIIESKEPKTTNETPMLREAKSR